MTALKNYYHPTPKRWRQIGDAVLVGSTSLSAMMMGAPFEEHTKTWIIFSLNVLGVAGEVITNFAKMQPDIDIEEKPNE